MTERGQRPQERQALAQTEVEAVTFDVWGTLLADPDWPRTYGALVDLVALYAGQAEPARRALDESWRRHYAAWRDGTHSGAFELARDALAELGVDEELRAVELAAAFSAHVLSCEIEAVEGARELLAFLDGRGLRLGLVCDTGFATGAVMRRLLERAGLGRWIDVQIYSDEWGAPKPHPRLFRAALASLDASAARTLHVGDLRRTDVAGARGVGMMTLRMKGVYDDQEELPDADWVADSHAEVRGLFDESRSERKAPGRVGGLIPPSLAEGPDRLDRRIAEGRVSAAHIDALAQRLADRHSGSRCDDASRYPGTVEKLSSELRTLCERIRSSAAAPLDETSLDELADRLSDFILLRSGALRGRVLGSRVRVVHGHLDATRVSISDDARRVQVHEPFAGALGATGGDIVRDLVDLHAALCRAGLQRLAERLLAAYAECAVDYRLYGVFDFHARLQALRRWAWYQALGVESEVRSAIIDLERVPSPKADSAPLVVATGGWVGVGKSTVSRSAAEALDAPRLEVDRVRAHVIDDPVVEPLRPGVAIAEREAAWERNFAPGFTEAVYAEVFRQARQVLESGRAVVLDGCFGGRHLRAAAARLASECRAGFLFLECRLEREKHHQRIAERERRHGSDPEEWATLAAEFERRWEPVDELGAGQHRVIDTARDEATTAATVADVLAASKRDARA